MAINDKGANWTPPKPPYLEYGQQRLVVPPDPEEQLRWQNAFSQLVAKYGSEDEVYRLWVTGQVSAEERNIMDSYESSLRGEALDSFHTAVGKIKAIYVTPPPGTLKIPSSPDYFYTATATPERFPDPVPVATQQIKPNPSVSLAAAPTTETGNLLNQSVVKNYVSGNSPYTSRINNYVAKTPNARPLPGPKRYITKNYLSGYKY